MGIGTQHLISKIRPPRVQITYDVEIGNARVVKELPFVMGILADLSGHNRENLPKFKQRSFVDIVKTNFSDVMTSMEPKLNLRVDNLLPQKSGKFDIKLAFNQMDDFHPTQLIAQIPALSQLSHHRTLLTDLLSKLNGNEELEEVLSNILVNDDAGKKLDQDLQKEEIIGTVKELFVNYYMALKKEQQTFAKQALVEFLRQIKQAPKEILNTEQMLLFLCNVVFV